jgi:hypothetical protein
MFGDGKSHEYVEIGKGKTLYQPVDQPSRLPANKLKVKDRQQAE